MQFGVLMFPFLGNDPFNSLMLIIVGSVFIAGTKSLAERKKEGYAFTIVGAILGAILFILQLLVLASNALGWALGFEDWRTWNIIDDISASIWIFGLIILAYVGLRVTNKLDETSKIFPNGGA